MADTRKSHKPIYRAVSPFKSPKLSKIPQPQHDIIVDLLVRTLSPIGIYRANLPKPPKKCSKKRKRKDAVQQTAVRTKEPEPMTAEATLPEIKKYALVGFNSVMRQLEELSASSRQTRRTEAAESKSVGPHLAAVFLFRPLDDLLYAHLPTLCYTASLAHPEAPPTRLVLLGPSTETKVAAAMAQSPSVSLLAVQESESDTVGVKALIDYVRENVEVVEVPWMKQAAEAQWLGTEIDVQ